MDRSFYNINQRKKKGPFAYCVGTGDTQYDNGLFFISKIIDDLLKTHYYYLHIQQQLIPELPHQNNKENDEIRFISMVLDSYCEVNLSKLAEDNIHTWNFQQLFNVIKVFNWPDSPLIQKHIEQYKTLVDPIKVMRNTIHAHTSKFNSQTELHFSQENYITEINQAVILLDMFTSGKIPYYLEIPSGVQLDLRSFLSA